MKLKIDWKYNDTEVYVNGVYGGYIAPIGNENTWYGNIYCQRGKFLAMEHFGLETKDSIINTITHFIQDNADAVLTTCKNVDKLNA